MEKGKESNGMKNREENVPSGSKPMSGTNCPYRNGRSLTEPSMQMR